MRDWKEYLKQQEIKVVAIGDIKPYGNNPRENEEAVPYVVKSIERFGFRNPILVDGDGVIIEGHTRRLAAIELGMEQVPVIYATDLTPEEVDALRVIDNKTAEFAGWKNDKLVDEILRLPDFNFEDFGFDLAELGIGVGDDAGQTDADSVPDVAKDEPSRSKRGEVYYCGDHRLMCGDSTSAEDVARLMGGEKADMVFTDPPYNVAFCGRSEKFDVIMNDNLSENEFRGFIHKFLEVLKTLNPSTYYICCNWAFYGVLQLKLQPKACIVWAKNVFGLGKGYRHQHEFILFDGHIHESIKDESDLWQIKKDINYVHPTQKPVELPERAICNSTEGGQVVIDLFGGSGSTLIACEKSNRKCRMMELDPHYCDVIRRRWAEFVHGEGCDWEALTPVCNGSGDAQ